MKKLVSLLLAAALSWMMVPAAQAKEPDPPTFAQAQGVVLQSVPANENSSVVLAQVTDALGDWDTHSTTLPVFTYSDQDTVRPGMVAPGTSGSYKFMLYNRYSKPIEYVFTYAETPAGILTFSLTQGAPSGTVPVGGSVTFTLEWVWLYHVDDAQDLADSEIGRQSAIKDRSELAAELKFVIEADEEPEEPAPDPWWKSVLPGVALGIGGLILGGGGLVLGGAASAWLTALSALPLIGTICWLLHPGCKAACGCRPHSDCRCTPGCDDCNWCEPGDEDEPPSDNNGSKPNPDDGPVTAPKTGDGPMLALAAGMAAALCGMMLIIMLNRRKKEGYP